MRIRFGKKDQANISFNSANVECLLWLSLIYLYCAKYWGTFEGITLFLRHSHFGWGESAREYLISSSREK